MKKAIIAATLLIATPALADMNAAEFFQRDRSGQWTGPLVNKVASPYGTLPKQMSAKRQEVARIVAREAQARLGPQWVDSALKLAKIESSYNCAALGPRVASHGGDRARGPMQVMPRTARAMGLDPERLTECEYGVRAGVQYMAKCIETGVRTHAQMASCFVSGHAGWQRKLHARAEKYRREYIRLAMR
jgi:hypothetical protein